MGDTQTVEELAGEVRTQLDTLADDMDERLSDERLEALVEEVLQGLLDGDGGDELNRKLRFSGDVSSQLAGSKYARFNLSVADVEFMHDLLQAGQRVGWSKNGPSDELRNVVDAVSDGQQVAVPIARSDDERTLAEMLAAGRLTPSGYERAIAALDQVYGAMDTSESGFGSELTGNQYVSELWRGARAQSRVFNQIRTFEMSAPTAFLPVEAAIPEMLFVSESTTSGASDYATSKTGSNRVQVDAKKFVIHQMWSGEMEEDSIIPFVPFLREQAARSVSHYSDSLVLNGDTTNTGVGNINLDDADPADTKHYLAFDGIRHVGLVDNTNNQADVAGAISLDDFRAVKGRMLDVANNHDWGHPVDPSDLLFVADPESADAVAFLDEVLTVDKYGPEATVQTGEQGRVLGHPLIASIAVSKTEADGKVSTTAANNTQGQIVPFNRQGFVAGWRRRLMVETERLPATDQNRIVYSLRMGFARYSPSGAVGGIECADCLFNISL